MTRSIAALAVALVVVACTPQHWEHPQLGTQQAQADLQACNQSARQQSFRYGGSAFDYGPRFARGPDGRVFVDPSPTRPYPDPYLQEGQLRDYCMRSKGYQLVPDEKH